MPPRQFIFCLTKPPKPDAAIQNEKLNVAYHESGHAVIARLPIGVVSIIRRGRADGFVSRAHEPRGVGHGYRYDKRRRRWLHTDPSLDWAGNKVAPCREVSQREHETEVLMSIAGGMAEAMHRDPPAWKNWKSRGSSADIRIARDHRAQIERPETWEHYEGQTHAMLLEFWSMVSAVAAALMRHGFLDAGEVDRVCGRVVRRQHLKMGAVKPITNAAE